MATRTTTPKATGWVLGTVVLVAAMGAGAWFALIGPVMDQTSETTLRAESVEDANRLQQVKIDRLRDQFEHLPEYKAELAALQLQIPTGAQLSEYVRELEAIAARHQVTIVDLAADVGSEVVPAVPLVPEVVAEPADAAESTSDVTPGSETPAEQPSAPAPAGPTAPEGFVAIPVAVTTLGTYENVVAFIESAQTGTQRLFLVAGFAGEGKTAAADASGGLPPVAAGDLQMTVQGFIYVLIDPSVASVPADEAEPQPLPAPPPGRNPVAPIPPAAQG